MKLFILLLLSLSLTSFSRAEEEKKENGTSPATKDAAPESIDVSDLEENYWRPNKEELEVVQNRRFEKKNRFELGLGYGVYQGGDYINTKSIGASLTYNLSNEWFVEASHHKMNTKDNEFLQSVRSRFGFTPDFNREKSQSVLSVGWVPIYAKFAFLGKKISHFEMYIAPGMGVTDSGGQNFSKHFTTGQKFFLTENILLRLEWRISQYNEKIVTTQGATSLANGGPGFVTQKQTQHNIIFGFGWMFP